MFENRHVLDVKKDELKQSVLQMAAMTAASLEEALQCFKHCDPETANAIIKKDEPINDQFEHIERNGFYVIASQQPVAHDLREIVVAMRIASELERIADHAANIAKIRLEIERASLDDLCISRIGELGTDVQSILNQAMSSYTRLDTGAAGSLKDSEMQIDKTTTSLTSELFECMKKDASLVEDGSRVLWVVHTLERISDRATNIAEQVIYAVTAHEEKIN